jgi:hypothetical protein
MNDPHGIVRAVEDELISLRQYRSSSPPMPDFGAFAQHTAKAEDVLKYGTLLYPKFMKVDGVVVLARHYTPENWAQWRETHAAVDAAAMVNHTHVTDFLYADYERAAALEDAVGEMIAFFWKLAVDQQFPEDRVTVEYDGDVIQVHQQRRTGRRAAQQDDAADDPAGRR